MELYCCSCEYVVRARLTDGSEIYPHREDLYALPFWKCDICKNYIGCHHKTENRTQPMGNIPNSEIRNARKHIHAILDPLWKNKRARRGTLYEKISRELGYQYHTGEIKTIEEARKVYVIVKNLSRQI